MFVLSVAFVVCGVVFGGGCVCVWVLCGGCCGVVGRVGWFVRPCVGGVGVVCECVVGVSCSR